MGTALDAGARCAFVLADALYGSDSRLRRMLEERSQPSVLAVRSNYPLRFLDGWALDEIDPAMMADDLPPEAWTAHAAGEGPRACASTTGPGSRFPGRIRTG